MSFGPVLGLVVFDRALDEDTVAAERVQDSASWQSSSSVAVSA
jgi:hypothetical protein